LITIADLLYDYAAFLNCFKGSEADLGHLYIFRRKKDVHNMDDWSGTVNATNVLIEEAKSDITKDVEKVKGELDVVKGDVSGLQDGLTGMRDGIQSMKADL